MGKIISTALIAAVLCGNAVADTWSVRHRCTKPYKPIQFNSKFELDIFLDEVDNYKRCIQQFVKQQNEEAENHMQAAKKAVEEWNTFVRTELQ